MDDLENTGGTAINDALASALDLRGNEEGRSFTVVFFTDGQPTIGETRPDMILKNTLAKNTANTRIFTFGVGDDVNATMLDQLAEKTRAISTYVRPSEDIENKVSGLYSKISNPVLTNLNLSATNDIKFSEVYPPELPDLFHGSQLVVLGRYSGQGSVAVKLTGRVGMETKEFVYELTFPDKTGEERDFVEQLWARRKVGYLLDQIRANGEKKELVDEVLVLAKKYGIATPYTSYLIVPDGPVPVVNGGAGAGVPNVAFDKPMAPPALAGSGGGGAAAGRVPAKSVDDFARDVKGPEGTFIDTRKKLQEEQLHKEAESKTGGVEKAARQALELQSVSERTYYRLRGGDLNAVQAGKLGVDMSVYSAQLRGQHRLSRTAVRQVWGRSCVEIGGVWIDESFTAKTPTLVVKAQSDAYFKLLQRQPKLKEVFRLGNYLLWVAPSGTALVIDTTKGKDKLGDAEIDQLFVVKK